MNELSVVDLCIRRGKKLVLDGLSFELRRGELLGIVGRNGSGKSTLLEALLGRLLPASGRILCDGRDLSTLSLAERAQRFGLVGREELEPLGLIVEEVLELALEVRSVTISSAEKERRIAATLAELGLGALRERRLFSLSSGERQLVHFARALLQAPRALLLDEATAHLDLAHREALLGHARKSAENGCSVLAVVHDLDFAIRHFDRLLVLDQGKARAVGTPREVLTSACLYEVFSIRAELRFVDKTPHLHWKDPS